MADRAAAQRQRQRSFEKARQLQKGEEQATAQEEVVIADETATDDQNTEATDPPEAALEEVRNYKYPLTLSQSYPARIIFTAYQVDGLDIGNKISQYFGSDEENEELSNALNVLESTTSSVSDSKVGEDTKKEINKAQKESQALLQSFDNGGPGNKKGSVSLPVPRDLRFSDNAQYETANLGTIGGALEGALGGQNPFAGATTNGQLSSTISALAAQTVARAAPLAAGALVGSLGGRAGSVLGALGAANLAEGVAPAVRSATRIATAPNQRTLFQQVNIRSFAFSFKMIANNADEAREIKNIIRFFREELYPEKISLGESGVPLAYRFPDVFEIEIKNKQGDNPAFKIQRCYLRDVQTSFNSTATGMYEDGRFVEVDISLAFQEIVALDKQKIKDGF